MLAEQDVARGRQPPQVPVPASHGAEAQQSRLPSHELPAQLSEQVAPGWQYAAPQQWPLFSHGPPAPVQRQVFLRQRCEQHWSSPLQRAPVPRHSPR